MRAGSRDGRKGGKTFSTWQPSWDLSLSTLVSRLLLYSMMSNEDTTMTNEDKGGRSAEENPSTRGSETDQAA